MDTGGYVIRNTNDYTGALAEVSRDTSSYYVIGYSPTNAKMDGTFRQISVRVKRAGRRGAGAQRIPRGAGGARRYGRDTRSASSAVRGHTVRDHTVFGHAVRGRAVFGHASTVRTLRGHAASGHSAAAPPAVDPANVPAGLATSPLVMRPDTATRVRDLETMSPGAGAVKDAASQGWDRYRKGDLEGAEQSLDQAAAQAGAAPWVHYALGFAKLGLKKPQEAAVSWERVRTAAPQFTEVYLDLADAYIMLDDPGRAVAVLRDAEHRWPANADVLNALGTVQVRRGALNDAIDTFRHAIERQPKDSLAYFNLARTHELRYYQMRRFSRPGARWIDNPEELKKAGEYYEAYVKMGGPYVDEARAGLQRVRFK